MPWQAMAGPSPVQSDSGGVVTTCHIQNTARGIGPVTVDIPNDGTIVGLTAAVRAYIANRTANGAQRQVVPSGTVLDLSDPAPPAPPAPPSAADQARNQWASDYASYRRYATGVSLGLAGYDAASRDSKLAALKASWIAGDPTYDALLATVPT